MIKKLIKKIFKIKSKTPPKVETHPIIKEEEHKPNIYIGHSDIDLEKILKKNPELKQKVERELKEEEQREKEKWKQMEENSQYFQLLEYREKHSTPDDYVLGNYLPKNNRFRTQYNDKDDTSLDDDFTTSGVNRFKTRIKR